MTRASSDPESIFDSARRLVDLDERERYLDEACGMNAELRDRIAKLLKADADAGSFLSEPFSAEIEPPTDSQAPTVAGTLPTGGLPSERPGAVIGRYTLTRQIGEGGFGLVFLAEQTQPVRRRVALKIIKLGMDTRQVIGRFEGERQALAMMDHPHVAKVLDAGATALGRPYFVMEFVEGVPITRYCDGHKLSVHERLGLFIQVCSAIQHAHQKGIIHRDIKPGNVLVAEVDGKPVPKVIDFGIAKATEQKLTERTMFTEQGAFLGTPAYMSPEQAEGGGVDVDTRSDIYSMGVLLYELLTGTTPFDMSTLRGAAISEIQRIVREEEPRKPSTRFTTIGDALADIAKARNTDVKRIRTALRGDLDWIIMKALEKDRERRYESAADFAKDLERYLSHEPVMAGPPSVSYRLQKFVRRNRTGVAAAFVAFVGLVGFAGTMAVQAQRIAAERDRANHERDMSDRVVEFQGDMLQRIRPAKLGESVATELRGQVERALSEQSEPAEQREATLASFDALLRQINLTDTARAILDANILAPASQAIEFQFAAQPVVEARLQEALARTYTAIGLPDKALAQAQRALEFQRRQFGEEHPDTLQALNAYAMILFDLDRKEECGAILRKSIASFEKALGPEHPDTLQAKGYLAALNVGTGARREYEELIEAQERVLGPNSEALASTLLNYGVVLDNEHYEAEAIPVLERAVSIFLQQEGPDARGTLAAMRTLAKVYQEVGRSDEAAELVSQVMERLERARGTRHPETLDAVAALASIYKAKGEYQKAEVIARKALELHRAVYGDTHIKTNKMVSDMGIILGMLGRHVEAERYHVEAYEQMKAARGPDDRETMIDRNNLAVHYWYLGQYQKALDLFAENLAGQERVYGKDHVATTSAMNNLAIVYTKLGRLDDARAILDRALAIRMKAFGPDHKETLQSRTSLAHLASEKKDWTAADQMYADLMVAKKKAFGIDHPYTIESTYNWALVKKGLGQSDEATVLMSDALERRQRVVGLNHPETLDTATALAELHFDAGRVDDARNLLTEVIAARRAAATVEGATVAQLNACAHILLVSKVEDLRNPAEALQYAQRANAATDNSDPTYLTTLARAYFDTGDPSKAIETQRKAIELLPGQSPLRAEYEERLVEYSSR